MTPGKKLSKSEATRDRVIQAALVQVGRAS